MKGIEFDQQNVVFAKDQPEYNSLPAHVNQEAGTSTFCFELDDEEVQQVQKDGKIYLTIFNQNQPLQPIGGSVLNPYK